MSDRDDNFDGDAEFADEAETDTPQRATAPIVYVRPVAKAQLPNPESIASDGPFYALHDADGRPLALFEDRTTAFIVARSNNMRPVSVH